MSSVPADEDLARSKRALIHDAAWASLAGALHGGVILTGFALALGAGPLAIGVLAAAPLVAQAAPRNLTQLLLHDRNDPAEGRLISFPPRQQERRYVGPFAWNSRDFTPETAS